MNIQKELDEMYMTRALALAKKAWGSTGINPRVGALIVKNNRLVGQGFHRRLGEAHAEICALVNAREKARGATLYVNLEPCCCRGRTPPCVVEIVKAGIKRVVIAMKDPNPMVNGNGIAYLQHHNTEITLGILRERACELNAWYKKYITLKKPYVIMKIALSRDNKIAGSPNKYMTSEPSRRYVHALRGQLNAVLVGINTIGADDPYLTDRLLGKNDPIRIVIDPRLAIPEKANFLKPGSRRIIITSEQNDSKKIQKLTRAGVEFIFLENTFYPIDKILNELSKKGISALLVEGGGRVFTNFFETENYDEIYLFQAKMEIMSGLALDKRIIDYVLARDKKPMHIGEDLLYHVYRNN
jgi:diaminohydroxyphosphoribosylaminopyrimidine deaminase/5-amino-6-(5-phosphoribosylamino)uracil reductase